MRPDISNIRGINDLTDKCSQSSDSTLVKLKDIINKDIIVVDWNIYINQHEETTLQLFFYFTDSDEFYRLSTQSSVLRNTMEDVAKHRIGKEPVLCRIEKRGKYYTFVPAKVNQ